MKAQFAELEARQRELRAGLLGAAPSTFGMSSGGSSHSDGRGGSSGRRSVTFSDTSGETLRPMRLPLTPEELGAAESVVSSTEGCVTAAGVAAAIAREAHNADEAAAKEAADVAALRTQVAQLTYQLEHERQHTKRLAHAQVICPHCEEFVPCDHADGPCPNTVGR